ncbi:MAG: NAD-dependent epimerase/dehydratase family protein [Clostridia bacterium]
MWTERKLNDLLTTPSEALIRDMATLTGDLMILGAGGKMGPTLCILAKRALEKAGSAARVLAVSRFSDQEAVSLLRAEGVTVCAADLMRRDALDALPDASNILFMAGRKFGTSESACDTWAMNATLPALVTQRFGAARYVAFSTGNVYPATNPALGGCTEEVSPEPVGEYAMSALARERVFEYAARHYGAKVLLYRLNYAVDLRYGVLHDLCERILQEAPISLGNACFNCIWQGYANEVALRALLRTTDTVQRLNVTGPETISVRYAAEAMGAMLGKSPVFEGEEGARSLLSQSGKCMEWFGYPGVSLSRLMAWQTQWVREGGRSLEKPTHFEEQRGQF